MRYTNLFFDLDRTLWDYDANSARALTEIFTAYKLHRYFASAEEFLEIYNHHNDILWERYRHGGISKEDLRVNRFGLTLKEKKLEDPALNSQIGEHYMDITPRLDTLFDHAHETLEYCAGKGYRMYILTNGFIKTQETKMVHSNILHYFKKIFSSEELGVNKPHSEFFHWAVSALHARKNECLMIGDDLEVDIKGAMSYGIDAAWFNPASEKSAFTPTYTIRDLKELNRLL